MTTNYSAPQPPQYPQPYGTQYPVQNAGAAPPDAYAYYQAAYPGYASAPSTVPSSVTTAFWLFMGQILISAINTIMIVVALAGSADHSVVLGATTYSGSPLFYVAAFVIGNAFWAAFAVMMLKGHNWARIVLTVGFALSVISTLVSMVSGIPFLLTGLATLAVGIAAVVMMYRSTSGPWFVRR